MQHAPHLSIIYHVEWQNARTKCQKDVIYIKNAVCEGVTAARFEIVLKAMDFSSES